MLNLLDLDKLQHFGPRRFMLLMSISTALVFLGGFAAVSALIDGTFTVDRRLLMVALGVGFAICGLFGHRLWRLPRSR